MQKRLKDFPMYLIDEKGNIFSEYSKKYLKTHLNNRGYVVCQLRDINSKNCIVLLHRLVAKTFIYHLQNMDLVTQFVLKCRWKILLVLEIF